MQRVHGVAGSWPQDLPLIHHHFWATRKSQTGHGQAMRSLGQGTGFVPGQPCGHNPHLVQLQLDNGRVDQGHMGRMRRVKGTPEKAQTLDRIKSLQIQSLGTKKWLNKRASGEPGSS